MKLAQRVALKYASRNKRHPDETVAEAYFQLTLLFLDRFFPLYVQAEQKERFVGIFIKRALIKYYEARGNRENRELFDKVVANTDQEMIDWLTGLFCDDDAFRVFHLLRASVSWDTIDMADPVLAKTAKRLRLAVSGRLNRLEMLKTAGLKTTREVIDVSPMDDTYGESGEAGNNPGESQGAVCPERPEGEQDQSSDAGPSGDQREAQPENLQS